MARGGARPGAGRPAGKSPTTSPPSRGRAHAREAAGNQRPWPADKVERWAIDRLIPYAKNARTHSDAQIAAIAASIKEWGCTTPALGIANYVEITSGAPRERTECVPVPVELVMGTMSSGQGHEISFARR